MVFLKFIGSKTNFINKSNHLNGYFLICLLNTVFTKYCTEARNFETL